MNLSHRYKLKNFIKDSFQDYLNEYASSHNSNVVIDHYSLWLTYMRTGSESGVKSVETYEVIKIHEITNIYRVENFIVVSTINDELIQIDRHGAYKLDSDDWIGYEIGFGIKYLI